MNSIRSIDAELEKIANKIKKEGKNIQLVQKQCEKVSKDLTRTK